MQFGRSDFVSLNLPRIKNDGSSTLAAPSADLVQALLGFPAAAGKPVTRTTATRVAAFLSGVKMMANDIAKMPLILRETSNDAQGRQRTQPAINELLYTILKDAPNNWHTSYQLRWFLASQLIMQGNCFCQKVLNQAGEIIALNPLDAWNMAPHWDRNSNPPQLLWRHTDGLGQVREFKQGELWHVANTNIDANGVAGTTIIALAKEALSVLMAAEETAGRNFANGLGMAGFISFPADSSITESQAQHVVDDLKKNFSGSQNAGKFTALPGGGQWQKMSFNAQESQLLESRKWNEQEIVRLLGGAPLLVKLGLTEQSSTYAASTAFLDEYFNTSLMPLTVSIEQSITRDLIPVAKRGKLYAKHSADIILRGSPEERAKTNEILIQSFQMTPNEARAIEDRDTIEGGDFLSGGTGTPVIYDIENKRFFIPGQLQPQLTDDEAQQKKDLTPDPPPVVAAPDTAGGEDGQLSPPTPPAKPDKAKNRLNALANSLADRVLRKEEKSKPDAKFVVEVLAVTKEQAEAYVSKRATLSADEARTELVSMACGE